MPAKGPVLPGDPQRGSWSTEGGDWGGGRRRDTAFFFGGVPHCLVNTEIRFIIFFAAKDEEALYSQ